jgi:hypothetical protein
MDKNKHMIRSLLFIFFINTRHCLKLIALLIIGDSLILLMHRFVPQDALARHFTPATTPFCPTRRSCETVYPCCSTILSHKTLLWDSSPLPQHHFVPQDALVGQFTPATTPFCPTRRSCGTVHPCYTVLSRITLFRDSSPLLKLRFVPNHPLSGQFTPATTPFCPESRSFGTVHHC